MSKLNTQIVKVLTSKSIWTRDSQSYVQMDETSLTYWEIKLSIKLSIKVSIIFHTSFFFLFFFFLFNED